MDITIFESKLNKFSLANSIKIVIQKVLFSLCVSNKSDGTLMANINKYFKPVMSYFVARHSFYQTRRKHDKTVNQWGEHVKNVASKCGFSSKLTTVIRDIFIVGIDPGTIQDRLLEKDGSKVGITYSL